MSEISFSWMENSFGFNFFNFSKSPRISLNSLIHIFIRISFSLLLNYLYSPYLLAWRRDHLSDYSDEQLATAICEASGVDINQLSISDMTLDNFLIELCVRTRSDYESEQYPDILKKLHEEADGMVWNG